MPRPRHTLICLDETPYYHCMSRCVRRAFLCGRDKYTGRSYQHRRKWVEDRLRLLADVFAIDLCAYAIMHNHTHLVLYVDKQKAMSWSHSEVLNRWHTLHKGTKLAHQYLTRNATATISEHERQTIEKMIDVYRKRLFDISWFMRLLNEFIAKQANKEDNCSGHFWEGRFKSQAIINPNALVATLAYVDLNPIRAGIASNLVKSKYTSIHLRINSARYGQQPKHLAPLYDNKINRSHCLPFTLRDYVELLNYTAQFHLTKKRRRKCKQADVPEMLNDIGVAWGQWLDVNVNLERRFGAKIQIENNLVA